MFNSYDINQSVKINAVNGTIVKNYRKSFMMRFHMNSPFANTVFGSRPKLNNRDIVVLQVMLCGDKELLAELIYKNDFDEIFKVESATGSEEMKNGNSTDY